MLFPKVSAYLQSGSQFPKAVVAVEEFPGDGAVVVLIRNPLVYVGRLPELFEGVELVGEIHQPLIRSGFIKVFFGLL